MPGASRFQTPGSRSGLQARRAFAVTAAGLALILVALIFDAAPLFVPGVALAAIGAVAPVWVWCSAHGGRAQRVLTATRVLEDEPLTAEIVVRRGWLGLGGWGRLEVIDPLIGTPLPLGGPGSPLRGARVARVRAVARFPRRGEQAIEPPSLVARDPLALARAQTLSAQPPQTVLVLPRTEPVRWRGGERGGRFAAGVGDPASDAMAGADLEGLRAYRPGTPASRIQWSAVARGRGLIERKLAPDGDNRPLLVLDPRERVGGDRRPAPLDAAVRATASLALDLARSGGCALLLPGQTQPTLIDAALSRWPAVHARLARVGTADPQPAGAPPLGHLAGRRGALIYVTVASHERLATGLTSAGRASVVLVVPDSEIVDGRPRGVVGRVAPTLTVSGCVGFALGDRNRSRVGATSAHSGARA